MCGRPRPAPNIHRSVQPNLSAAAVAHLSVVRVACACVQRRLARGSNKLSSSRCCCCCCCSEVPQGVPPGVRVLRLLLQRASRRLGADASAPPLRLLVPQRVEQRFPDGTDHHVFTQQPVVTSQRRRHALVSFFDARRTTREGPA